MRWGIIVLLLAVAVTDLGWARPPRYGRKEGYHALGLQAGLGRPVLAGSPAPSLQRAGLCVGGFFNYTLNNTFSIRPEVLYAQKAGTFPTTGQPRRLHCLDAPLLLFINAHGLYRGGLVFEAGPQLSYLLAAPADLQGPAPNPMSNRERLAVGFAAGVGYQRKVGPYHFSSRPSHYSGHGGSRSLRSIGTGLRYTADLRAHSQIPGAGHTALRNHFVQIYLTYSFNLHLR